MAKVGEFDMAFPLLLPWSGRAEEEIILIFTNPSNPIPKYANGTRVTFDVSHTIQYV